jgi:hypothetical protein
MLAHSASDAEGPIGAAMPFSPSNEYPIPIMKARMTSRPPRQRCFRARRSSFSDRLFLLGSASNNGKEFYPLVLSDRVKMARFRGTHRGKMSLFGPRTLRDFTSLLYPFPKVATTDSIQGPCYTPTYCGPRPTSDYGLSLGVGALERDLPRTFPRTPPTMCLTPPRGIMVGVDLLEKRE